VKKNSFALLELEIADLERFWKKTPLGPLGVKSPFQCSTKPHVHKKIKIF
jgi:hypothetical protein